MCRKATLSVVLFLQLFLWCSMSTAGDERPQLIGEVAYSEPMIWDYDRDGENNKVHLWASLDIKPALGKEGESGY